ncbi:unnamed protein product [Trichobilharzia szidati]|nr:unnamed protein product [Trichobilharzia szidati]
MKWIFFYRFLECMELFYHEDISLSLITEQLPGCLCKNICSLNNGCTCLSKSGKSYDANGLLINFVKPVFECNSECKCSQSCANRVVQNYLQDAQNSFESDYSNKICVSNYPIMGEVIPYKEACLREARQLSSYGRNYILILREYSENRLVSETCIDGNQELWGSVKSKARFINHSCTPNLTVIPVRVDSFIPYLALFANKTILSGTQLSYDYAQSVPGDKMRLSRTPCLCNSESCRIYMPEV